jgi:hypothetical protein
MANETQNAPNEVDASGWMIPGNGYYLCKEDSEGRRTAIAEFLGCDKEKNASHVLRCVQTYAAISKVVEENPELIECQEANEFCICGQNGWTCLPCELRAALAQSEGAST